MYYEVSLENDKLLKESEFVQFCVDHQNKDIVLKIINEGHCLEFCGVYKILDKFNFNSVIIKTWNILESHPRYTIDTTDWYNWLKHVGKFDLNYNYEWNKDKIFGCFYGRPSAPRLGIAGHLASKHNDKSFIQTKFDFDSEDKRKLFDLQRLFAWQPEAINNILQLKTYNNKEISYVESNYNTANTLSYLYKNFLIDIVAEPTCKGTTFYPTEKVTRAILCRRPFIAMCSKNYLIYLRQMGFKTFHDYWNESYDGFDGQEKYHMILKLIDDIATKTNNELDKMYQEMQSILEHNRRLIVTQTYSTQVYKID